MPDDSARQTPVPSLTRREAVAVLASGFALAVEPVTAATITTDAPAECCGGCPVDGRRGCGQQSFDASQHAFGVSEELF